MERTIDIPYAVLIPGGTSAFLVYAFFKGRYLRKLIEEKRYWPQNIRRRLLGLIIVEQEYEPNKVHS